MHGGEREGVPVLLAHAPTSSWPFFLPDLVFFCGRADSMSTGKVLNESNPIF